jgi:hypothetical protein
LGRGLAREAVGLAIAHAFGGPGLRRIEADIDPRNLASCALVERLGFQREGLLRERWHVGESCATPRCTGCLRATGDRGTVVRQRASPEANRPSGENGIDAARRWRGAVPVKPGARNMCARRMRRTLRRPGDAHSGPAFATHEKQR